MARIYVEVPVATKAAWQTWVGGDLISAVAEARYHILAGSGSGLPTPKQLPGQGPCARASWRAGRAAPIELVVRPPCTS